MRKKEKKKAGRMTGEGVRMETVRCIVQLEETSTLGHIQYFVLKYLTCTLLVGALFFAVCKEVVILRHCNVTL